MTKRNPFAHLSPHYAAEAPDGDDGTADVEPLPCRICDGDGDTPSGADCPRCDGSGEEAAVECSACDGEGEVSGSDCAGCDGEGRRYPDGTPYTGGEAAAAAFGAAAASALAKARPGFTPEPGTGMTRKAKRAAFNKAVGLKTKRSAAGRKQANRASAETQTFAAQMAVALKKLGR